MVRGPEQYAQDWIKMGIKLEKEMKYEKAEDAFRKAIKYKPDLAKAWMHLGLVLGKLGKTTEAEDATSKAIELDPSIAVEGKRRTEKIL